MGTSLLAAVGAQQLVLWGVAKKQMLDTTSEGKTVGEYKDRWNKCEKEMAKEAECLATNPRLGTQRIKPGLKLSSWPAEKQGPSMEQWKREATEHWETMLRNRKGAGILEGRAAKQEWRDKERQEWFTRRRARKDEMEDEEMEEIPVNLMFKMEKRKAYHREYSRRRRQRSRSTIA